ncbi:hypothetical protein SteCoe_5658 [Stentor coeruleus]|uniref:non-specific serine/threonine protein kinase n=1 Tax=Stentor coeruleus TaxID=5963 RepID=A0A1R2CRY0_9CILI|nr:hypothetical protein SteCoe_5658 [Stentor coeruleus]
MGCSLKSSSSSKKKLLGITNISQFPRVKSSPLLFHKTSSLYDDYATIKYLGSGAFSEVMLCLHRPSNEHRALKIIKKALIENSHFYTKSELKEAKIMKILDHPHIIKYFECFEDLNCVYVSMEYCQGGDLYSEIKKVNKFNEETSAEIMVQLLSAVQYLHEKNIVHRDLKLQNLLLGQNSNNIDVKIADFGSACWLSGNFKAFGYFGTPAFQAPEVMKGFYDEKVDIWSCGVILYALLQGKILYHEEDIANLNNQVLDFSIDHSDFYDKGLIIDFIKHLIRIDPKERYSAKDALNHPWIQQHVNKTFGLLSTETRTFAY